MVFVIKESKDLDTLTFEELEGSLQVHELKIKKRQEDPLEQVLKAKASLKNDGGEKSQRGHGRKREPIHGQRGRGKGNGENSNNEKRAH